jgi:hypothetical protein
MVWWQAQMMIEGIVKVGLVVNDLFEVL